MKKKALPHQEINSLISLLKSPDSEDWKLALNILAHPTFKVKRQLCQAVKFARIYVKHPYQLLYYSGYDFAKRKFIISTPRETLTLPQLYNISRRCLKYLELYKNYDKRRIS